jgi:hypothetical protein
MRNPNDLYYTELLEELDNLDIPLSHWEVDFIESTLRLAWFTDRQKAVIEKLKERYLL